MAMANRYLIVGPAWVGDMVMAQSLFMSLKSRDTTARIDVLAPAWTRALLDRMPEVSSAITSPFGHSELQLGARRRLGRTLIRHDYDQAIVLPNSIKAALVPYFAKIPHRTGFKGEYRYGLINDIRTLDKDALPLTVQRFIALGNQPDDEPPQHPPMPRLQPIEGAFESAVSRLGLGGTEGPVLALAPGAEFGASKKWPEAHFAKVAHEHLRKGWQVWLFGSENDADATGSINRMLGGRGRDLAGQTRLEDAIDLLSGCSAAVTNDSGLMHVAAALGLPVAAVYGSTSPTMTPPLSTRARSISIDIECRPCFKRECPLEHLDCLNQLQPELVMSALDELLPAEEQLPPAVTGPDEQPGGSIH